MLAKPRIPSLARRRLAWAVLLAAGLATACGAPAPEAPSDETAIRSAIDSYLRTERGINPAAMQVEIITMQVQGDVASVRARFSSEQMPQGLEYEYELQRTDGLWSVTSSSGAGHGGAQGMPEGHPPMPQTAPAAPDDATGAGSS